MTRPVLTFTLMDAPFESTRTTTAMRLIDAAIRHRCDVNVFAYEGAVLLPFALQTQHANAIHGRDAAQEDHPLPREWIASLMQMAQDKGVAFDWINCGLCVDERGAGQAIEKIRRGSPADFAKMAAASISTLVIATR